MSVDEPTPADRRAWQVAVALGVLIAVGGLWVMTQALFPEPSPYRSGVRADDVFFACLLIGGGVAMALTSYRHLDRIDKS